MKIMELEADIVLNADSFVTDLSNAVDDAKTLATQIDDLNKAPEGVTATQLNNVVDDASKLKTTVDDAKKSAHDTELQMDELKEKGSSTLGTLMETFAGVAGSLVETVIAGIFELGAEGIEMAAATDSPLAQAYNRAVENLEITRDAARMEVGEALLPLATSVQQLIDSILTFALNLDDADKLLSYLDRLETYEAENLKKVSSNIEKVFKATQMVPDFEPANIEDMFAGVESQTDYWENYYATIQSLMDKGVDYSVLADFTDGKVESLAQLQALDAATPENLQAFVDSMKELEEAESNAAQIINTVQVDLVSSTDGVLENVAGMVAGLDEAERAKLNMGATMDAIIESIAARIPAFSGYTQQIKEMAAEIAEATAVPFGFSTLTTGSGFSGWNMVQPEGSHASGLGYVPYDGYLAELHRGEAVLTRQQAEGVRAGSDTAATPTDPAVIERAISSALARWLAPVGTNQIVGIVNSGLANETRGVR